MAQVTLADIRTRILALQEDCITDSRGFGGIGIETGQPRYWELRLVNVVPTKVDPSTYKHQLVWRMNFTRNAAITSGVDFEKQQQAESDALTICEYFTNRLSLSDPDYDNFMEGVVPGSVIFTNASIGTLSRNGTDVWGSSYELRLTINRLVMPFG